MSTTKLSNEILEKLIVKSQQPAGESNVSESQVSVEPTASETPPVASAPTTEMLTLGLHAGVVSDDPIEAWRAGYVAGEKSRTTAGTSMAGLCWVCGREPEPPSHVRQVEILREIHLARTPIFHWPREEFARLVEILDEMGPGAYLDGIKPFGAIFYSEVRIVHAAGSVVDLSRGKLQKVTR
jgi:hypothetical protein